MSNKPNKITEFKGYTDEVGKEIDPNQSIEKVRVIDRLTPKQIESINRENFKKRLEERNK